MTDSEIYDIAKHFNVDPKELIRMVKSEETVIGRKLDYNEIEDIAKSIKD
jgi:hypothetical protein